MVQFLETLFVAYKLPPDKARTAAYVHVLGGCTRRAGSRVLAKLDELWPKYCPMAPELKAGMLRAERDIERERSTVVKRVPSEPVYRQDPDSPFMRLAARYEQENLDMRSLGIGPEDVTPKEIGAKRTREIFELLGRHWVGGDL